MTRFKMLPVPPADLEAVADAQRALPLVPADEDDCCARLVRRCGYPTRDVARTWITFLRALGLAEETSSGFKRLGTEPTPAHLRTQFLDRIMLAEEVLGTLVAASEGADGGAAGADGGMESEDGRTEDVEERTEDVEERTEDVEERTEDVEERTEDVEERTEEPLDVDAVFARVRDDVPTYEHHKNPTEWESIWRDRTADLLGWLVLLDLAERTDATSMAGDGGYLPTDRGRDAVA